jgi:hypothetical protein
VRPDVPELARNVHRRGAAEEQVARRALTDKATDRNGIATAIDPRQLEFALEAARTRAQTGGGPDERARAIVRSLDSLSSEEVFAAFEELDSLPADVVRAVLAESTGPAPDPELLDDALRKAHGFPPRPLGLKTIAIVKDADIFDLGDFAEEQIRIAGKSWDGRDLAAEERLDGEVEGSWAGTLEHRVLADAASNAPLFDVLLYGGDAGSIFRASTTELVGAIAGTTVEMKDRRARVAIQAAFAEPLVVLEPVVEAAPEPTKKKQTTEAVSVSAKKSAKKKTAAPAVKKATGTKKATATKKTTAAKKATAPKKTATKKASAAKAPAKKAAKKSSAKKSSKKAASDD